MNILDIAIIIFILAESANVAILYFAPDSRLGNGVAVFNPWFSTKEDKSSALFSKYMANWVAGSKLIFIVLLIVILVVGNEATKVFSVIGIIFSVCTYFFCLHPIVKKLDALGELTPVGYSKALLAMIIGFVSMFTGALIYYFIT